MLFVLVGFFQTLQLTLITEPLNRLLTQLAEFAPRLLGASLLLLIAWVVGSGLRLVVSKGLTAAKLDERLGGEAGLETEKRPSLTKTLSDAVYWLVFLLFLPAVLGALELQGLLEPVQRLTDRILGFLPNILAAGLILAVGWFVARIVQRIVSNLLAAVGVDQLGERVGLSTQTRTRRLSGVIGLILYFLILIPVVISALNALALCRRPLVDPGLHGRASGRQPGDQRARRRHCLARDGVGERENASTPSSNGA
jgi:hypothetical protein